jgi:hypothetical protein
MDIAGRSRIPKPVVGFEPVVGFASPVGPDGGTAATASRIPGSPAPSSSSSATRIPGLMSPPPAAVEMDAPLAFAEVIVCLARQCADDHLVVHACKTGGHVSRPLAPVAVTQVNQPVRTAAVADVAVTRVDQPVWTAAADGDAVQQEWPAPEYAASPSRRRRGPAAKSQKIQACDLGCPRYSVNATDISGAESAHFTRRSRKSRFNRLGVNRTTATATSQQRRYRSHASGATDVWVASVDVLSAPLNLFGLLATGSRARCRARACLAKGRYTLQ